MERWTVRDAVFDFTILTVWQDPAEDGEQIAWARDFHAAMQPHATGVYVNSMLAVGEANRAGYDEAILLTAEGTVADGSGESIFLVRDGVIYTPDLSASILVGITRDTVIQIAQDLGHRVVEKPIIRTDLYLADEVFMVGTAAEVTPIREVDDQEIGPPGPVTREIQQAYLDTVHGRSERWSQWLEFAPAANHAEQA